MSTNAATAPSVKLALIQLLTGADKPANLAHARTKVLEASRNGAGIIVLPECFNSPYGTEYFAQYAERIPPLAEREEGGGTPSPEKYPTFTALRKMAIDANAYLVAGSIPEAHYPKTTTTTTTTTTSPEKPNLYNTSLTFSPSGTLLGLHRKIHLFDIDIPGKITFTESLVLSPGTTPTIISLPPYGTIGVQICYDVRFPELSQIYARKGVFAIIVPGAFNLTTGPLHWELLARGRANDNQVFVGMCSPARTGEEVGGYKAWGESMVVDPSGRVVGRVEGGGEGVVYADLEVGVVEETRMGIPVGVQRRWDVYRDVAEGWSSGDEKKVST
ncbi:nitrilase family protein-like protein [Peziza echinospora]|nr:nitrilase family protein-like protein [Peziza echinospora]